MKRALAVIALCGHAASAQTPSFEVASVKPAALGRAMPLMELMMGDDVHFRQKPGRIDYRGVTLRMLLKRAWELSAEQISGPGWLDTERYDISATLPPDTAPEQLRLMLQGLLLERFQMRLHHESKPLPVCVLTIAKNGPKLKPAEAVAEHVDPADMRKQASDQLQAMERGGDMAAYGRFLHLPRATSAKIAQTLESLAGCPVEDQTGLDGIYSFTLRWAMDETRPGPTIFAAVEDDLGLKLNRITRQLDLMVIDHAEKLPTSN
jgi:uncharacterized protein (TIGR03435 family)